MGPPGLQIEVGRVRCKGAMGKVLRPLYARSHSQYLLTGQESRFRRAERQIHLQHCHRPRPPNLSLRHHHRHHSASDTIAPTDTSVSQLQSTTTTGTSTTAPAAIDSGEGEKPDEAEVEEQLKTPKQRPCPDPTAKRIKPKKPCTSTCTAGTGKPRASQRATSDPQKVSDIQAPKTKKNVARVNIQPKISRLSPLSSPTPLTTHGRFLANLRVFVLFSFSSFTDGPACIRREIGPPSVFQAE